MLEHRFEEFKLTGNLPSPTGVGLAILRITQSDDASLEELVAVLQTDPTLTGRILKLANCGEMSGQHPATTVRSAAMRLGFSNVRNVSLGFSLLAGNRTGRCTAFDYDEFWSHSLAVAVAAQTVAERRGGVTPSDAFTCGLLSGMGRLALASVHPSEYEGVLAHARGQGSARLAEIELECFGTNHREITAAMLKDWNLPAAFADAVSLVGSGASPDELTAPHSRQLARTLQSARDLARALMIRLDAAPDEFRRIAGDLERMMDHEELDEAALAELWEAVSAGWRTWGDSVQIRARSQIELGDLRQRAEAPAAAASRATTGPAGVDQSDHRASARQRILQVGLAADVGAALASELEGDGCEVVTAADGQTALACALDKPPQVLVSGWDLGQLEGPELVRALERSGVESLTRAILVAGRDQEFRLLDALDSGVDEYLLEPVDVRHLAARVRAALEVASLNGRVQDLLCEREDHLRQIAVLTRKLEVSGLTDALTGLFSRRYGLEQLDREISAAQTSGRTLSVILFDIDRLKAVNDRHGHEVGDFVLRDIAMVLRSVLRRGDTVARMGGEEFLVICAAATLDAAGMIAERLRVAARSHVIQSGELRLAVTISLGAAELDPAQPTADALVKRAEQRLCLAKAGGCDRVVIGDALGTARRTA